MESPKYYSVTTRRFTLKCSHPDWLLLTGRLYNEVILFYYRLFLDCMENKEKEMVWGTRQSLRELELLTIVGRDKKEVPCPLPWSKLPLYFRRAAVNAAVVAGKGYLSRKELRSEGGQEWTENRTEVFHNAVTFYKGMYRELTQEHISLKVWDGVSWRWMRCRLGGNHLPEQAALLSPSLFSQSKYFFLDIPVRENVNDGRRAAERIKQGERLCSVQFTNGEHFAAAVALDGQSRQTGIRFFGGGLEYAGRCRRLTERIAHSEKCMRLNGGPQAGAEPVNKVYWMKLKHVSETYAHRVSRQIVDFCAEQKAGILVLPEYDSEFNGYVMHAAGSWSPIQLSARIRQQLFYKAWRQGIIVLEVNAAGCSGSCSVCGAKTEKRGSDFVCANGHRGNRYVNFARNLGVKCRGSFLRNNAEETG